MTTHEGVSAVPHREREFRRGYRHGYLAALQEIQARHRSIAYPKTARWDLSPPSVEDMLTETDALTDWAERELRQWEAGQTTNIVFAPTPPKDVDES